ncbi:MAG: hypothetical protein LBP63_02325 [Prevotellaceae bacterium]|jgi:hypothetical protein|nr:hypothetical protein [Prevotellaceae bacterium]
MKQIIIDLTLFKKMCGGGRCPKILLNEDGDALVQGLLVDDSIKKTLNVPQGEDIIFLPKEIIQEFLENNK